MKPDSLQSALYDDDVEVRREAVMAIGSSRAEGLGPQLLVALGDSEWRVRKEAALVAREHAVRLGILPDLVEAICQGENVGLRNAALEVLEELGPEAADVLLEALPKVPDHNRRFVIEALACGGDERVVATLAEAVDGSDSMVAVAAMEALAAIGGTHVDSVLRSQLKSSDSFRRMAALDGLNRIGAVVAWEELSPLLTDRLVRRVALGAMGRCGRREAVAPLVQALSERSAHVLSTAVVALAQLTAGPDDAAREVVAQVAGLDEGVLGRLRAVLHEGVLEARRAAAQILSLAQDRAALPGVVALTSYESLPLATLNALRTWGPDALRGLIELAESPSAISCGRALELASELATDPSIADPVLIGELRRVLRTAISHGEPGVVRAAVRCMEHWGEAYDAVALVRAAQADGPEVAQACGLALVELARRARPAVEQAVYGIELDGPAGAPLATLVAELGGPNAFSRLQAGLSSQDADTRKAVVTGLAKLGGAKAAELVAFCLADESVDVQMTAARALGKLRDEAGRPVGIDSLFLALHSESPGVQAATVRALGDAGDERAIEPLRSLARTGGQGVVPAAIEALRRLGDSALDELLVEALSSDDEEVVKQALVAIFEGRARDALEHLNTGLKHPAWDVRQLAADLLGELGDKRAVASLRAQLEVEQDELVAGTITGALARLEEEA